ncbi:F-box protein At3g07870-like [Papaver somniferum]|uniref:F-box protein At3g07870-like n=1 Tax=Papaver somniferum TaxID=3469 RepID=UPI000E7020BF|nr:F-box protein At3g07870-like [Papaver somniferum]
MQEMGKSPPVWWIHNFNDMHVKRQLQHIYAGDSISHDWAKVDIGLLFAANYLSGKGSLFYGREYGDKINFDFFGSPSMLFGRAGDYGLIGSCNGLIFSGKYQYHKDLDIIIICNPITGEYANISGFIKCNKDLYISQVVRGFGYVRTTNEYKVVRIYYRDEDEDEDYMGRVQVYTLGSGCGWRNKQTSCPRLNDRMVGTCANGAIHWNSNGSIHAFDLANEEFRTVS